ncbi:MAG: hypothetical protein ACM3JE_01540 [Betaproteobacteria bacterium]
MQFKYKIAAALAVFALLIGIVYAIQYVYLNREVSSERGDYSLDEAFTAEDLLYGPQAWAPYATKMPLVPGADVEGDDGFYLLFVDLNATSNLNSTFPRVQVDYAFSGLHGTAAFHVYGYIHSNGALSWTNRVEGSGASGYYVIIDQQSTSSVAGAHTMKDFNHVYVKVANAAGASFDDNGDDTYLMRFEKAGGGLNSLHITTDPRTPTGQVTNTSNSTGTFFVTFTGDRVQDTFVLLVAVNGTIGNDFTLNFKASVPG